MRSYLTIGTWIKLSNGEHYRITGAPLGEGGGSIVYPCEKINYSVDGYTISKIKYAIKECYPLSSVFEFVRDSKGEITPKEKSSESEKYLQTVKQMQLSEFEKAETIYNTSSRMIPVISGTNHISISIDDGQTFQEVNNTMTVMPSLELKGTALRKHLEENDHLSVIQSLQLIKLILLAVKEIHDAGFLHLDIQDGNVFVKGSLREEILVSLIDFGSTRKVLSDGLCEVINDGVIFSTNGFSAPEIVECNDGTLRLGKEADIYSIGYTLLLLLTGRRYSQRELTSVNMGHILPGRRIKKIGCPPHMADRLRQILGRATEKSTIKRYHSCDEMLVDVCEVIDALIPYQTTLSQVVYDAFICYKHGKIDSPISKLLQEKLEHYHCPKGTAAKKKKINKVFVDEGELSSCADFGLQIREALKNSEWLIVICSPETKGSPWVNLEIRTFLEYHDRSHILALITEGEPKDVFPDELLGNTNGTTDVLAADVRGENLSQIIKKLKKDAVLKLAAPILGVPYDSLRQRQKQYRTRKISIYAIVTILLINSFAFYSLMKNMKISEQDKKIQRSIAQNYLTQAETYMKKGKREKALKSILSIQDNAESPVIPEEIYIFNSALHSYFHQDSIEGFRPLKELELDSFPDILQVTDNGETLFCIDDLGTAYFFDMEEYSLIWKYQIPGETIPQIQRFFFSEFISNQEMVIISNESVFHLNLETQTCIEEKLPQGYTIYGPDEVSYANGTLALINSLTGTLYVQDIIEGTSAIYDLLQVDGLNNSSEFSYFSVHLSPDGSSVAVYAIDRSHSVSNIINEVEPEIPGDIYIINLVTEEKQVLHTDNYIVQFDFISDHEIATLEREFAYMGTKDDTVRARYYEVLYNLEKGKVHQSDSNYFLNYYINELKTLSFGASVSEISLWGAGVNTSDKLIDVIFIYFGKHLLVLDRNDYKILLEKTFNHNIKSVDVYDRQEILVGLSDGSVGCMRNGQYEENFSIQTKVSSAIYNENKQIFIQSVVNENILIVSGLEQDNSLQLVLDESFESPQFYQEDRIDGCNSNRFAIIEDGNIKVYEEGNTDSILVIPIVSASEDSISPLFSFFNSDTQLIVYTQDNMLSLWDIKSGKMISVKELDLRQYIKNGIVTDSDGKYFALHQNDGTVLYDTDTYEFYMKETNVFCVDEDGQIYRYADIPYGFVNFEQNMIYTCSRSDGKYYSAALYNYSDLRKEAEKLISESEVNE